MRGAVAAWRWTTVLSVALVLAAHPDARAWGKLEHRAASRLAERRLSASARAAVATLLDDDESLADASLWADDHRRDLPGSAGLHYVNVPLDAQRYDARFCPATGCVVSAIIELQNTLENLEAPRSERQRALRLLIHFVEDLHQPLHVGDRSDRGGNDLPVLFFEQPTNLHRVWDEGLVERRVSDELMFTAELAKLSTPRAVAVWGHGGVEQWANESLALAKAAYVRADTDAPLAPGEQLGEAYEARERPVAVRRLAQAGVRLATLLNRVFRR